MPKLPEHTVAHLARVAACDVAERVEDHTDAHPLRYGHCDLSEAAFDAITERVEFEVGKVLREFEFPPK